MFVMSGAIVRVQAQALVLLAKRVELPAQVLVLSGQARLWLCHRGHRVQAYQRGCEHAMHG